MGDEQVQVTDLSKTQLSQGKQNDSSPNVYHLQLCSAEIIMYFPNFFFSFCNFKKSMKLCKKHKQYYFTSLLQTLF